ncbi:MAG: tRNA-2-methylthio-N6-dimethylallyladenosine synthase [Bacteroidota bacterium]|nr:tRNA-2-methylthio-N6-dimethylallyladenosine synthase [Bacteroidota bacterium]
MKNIYIETYGCQMNFSDTEILSAILKDGGFGFTETPDNADFILLNTCSIRENAEDRIFKRLQNLKKYKKSNKNLKFGVLGCMAERLQEKLSASGEVSLVVGPDEYRKLPELIESINGDGAGIAVNLEAMETYNDVTPLRTDDISAWLSIMRGCNNFCTYCVVPYTRGRERSRSSADLLAEVERLAAAGYKELTFLGQNVNSYLCPVDNIRFADLLDSAARTAPEMRLRFITSHPRDMSEKLIDTIAIHKNICNHIHLPVQSGSDSMLANMKRKYNSSGYLKLIGSIRNAIPDAAITTDIIAGFPGETNDDHKATLDLIKEVRFDGAFMFRYSAREGTAAYKLNDDVPEEEKIRRLNEIIHLQQDISKQINKYEHDKIFEILVENPSKRNPAEWQGRTDTNKVVIFPNENCSERGHLVRVKIIRSTAATLFGELVI